MAKDISPQEEACQIRFNRIVSILSAAVLRLENRSEKSEKSGKICE
jgi:hypothetical protein